MKTHIYEIILASIILILLLFFINPFHILMPTTAVMIAAVVLVLVFCLFAAFVWKENGGDEREKFHKMLADRMAFLVGSGIIVIAIIVEVINHNISIWLIAALAAMVVAKIVGLIYGRNRY